MIGTTLAHYRVLSLLGRGGMGDVFLAEDLALVARWRSKVLPPALAEDADRQRRFEREARAIAALNHPNIVTIYGIERAGETTLLRHGVRRRPALAQLIPAEGMPLPALPADRSPLAEAIASPTARASSTAT